MRDPEEVWKTCLLRKNPKNCASFDWKERNNKIYQYVKSALEVTLRWLTVASWARTSNNPFPGREFCPDTETSFWELSTAEAFWQRSCGFKSQVRNMPARDGQSISTDKNEGRDDLSMCSYPLSLCPCHPTGPFSATLILESALQLTWGVCCCSALCQTRVQTKQAAARS